MDARVTAMLADPSGDAIADAALEGVISAAAYRAPTPMQATAARAPIQKAPALDAEQVDELLFGEAFAVLETEGDAAACLVFEGMLEEGVHGGVDVGSIAKDGVEGRTGEGGAKFFFGHVTE